MLVGHPVFWILAAAVLAPLLAEIPIGFKVPVVVLEVVLGIVIGPHVLNLVHFDGFMETMFAFGMAATLFMGGMELDFDDIKGRPMILAVGGWTVSVMLSVTLVGLLHAIPHLRTPLIVALAMCTTGLSVVVPELRDSGQLGTVFGRLILAAGTLGEVGPIVAMSLLLSQHYSIWQEGALLLVYLAIIAIALAVGVGVRPPRVLEILSRHMRCCGGYGWRRNAVGPVIPDDCERPFIPKCRALIKRQSDMTKAHGERSHGIPRQFEEGRTLHFFVLPNSSHRCPAGWGLC